MSAVIVVFVVWFAVVLALAIVAIAIAPKVRAPRWLRAARERVAGSIDVASDTAGRVSIAVLIALALWSVIIMVGWGLGWIAHKLQGSIDRPAFDWWDAHRLHGAWSTAWWKLTNVGSTNVTQILTVAGAVVLAILYARRARWWGPSVTLLAAYLAEHFSQNILKAVVHRGHPPTSLGTWPSGGMGRLVLIYGLIIYFVIKRFWPDAPRVWAAGWSFLAVCASVQAYARLNNLEHWTTDVVGGGIYGVLLLLMMIAACAPLLRPAIGAAAPDAPRAAAAPAAKPASSGQLGGGE